MGISITSANAQLTLTARNRSGAIIVGPFTIQGYAVDAAFAMDPVSAAEAVMGVDGKMAVGRTPYITEHNISLMANSPSVELMDTIENAQQALGDQLVLDGFISAPSLGRGAALVNGALTTLTKFATAAKTFNVPMTYKISWESVTPAPLSV